jgi:hypothetical protein
LYRRGPNLTGRITKQEFKDAAKELTHEVVDAKPVDVKVKVAEIWTEVYADLERPKSSE